MKKITAKDILSLMDEEQEVIIAVYAYGISYANSWTDGFSTVNECLHHVREDILSARVCGVESIEDTVRIVTDLTADGHCRTT